MKKFFAFLMSICLLFALCACNGTPSSEDEPDKGGGSGTETPVEDESTSLLTDKKFKNGFKVRGLGEPIYPEHADEETTEDKFGTLGMLQYGQSDLEEPVWTIAQWSSRYSLHDPEITDFETISEGVYRYENRSKLLQVNTETGEVTLGLKASECYVYGDRVAGQEWPHFLLERDITNQTSPSPFTKISSLKKINVSVDARLDYYEDCMTTEADDGLHAAQLMYYVFVSHRNPQTKSFDDMIWFGLPVFDNRTENVEQADFVDTGSKGSATEKYIYNLGSSQILPDGNGFYKDGEIYSGEDAPYVHVEVDILPYIRTAFDAAQAADCMLNSTYENLYINGMYIGFELPGTYDIQMSLRNLDIRVV